MGASVIAAAAMRAEREIIEHLRRARATSPERAVQLPDLRHLARRRLDRLLTARVVNEVPNGYWLDEPMYESYRSDRRGIVLIVIGILLVSLLGVAISKAF